VPIDWLTYQNGLPKPGGGTPPPPLTSIPAFSDNEGEDASGGQAADVAASAAAAPDSNAPPGAIDENAVVPPAALPPAPPPPARPRLPALPGNPAFVGGFASQHPNISMAVMGDGSVRAVFRNISRSVLQGLANRSDGKLPNSDF
jgi:hypothetical protein